MEQKKKNIKSFIREEDGKTIKKSLLISSLGLILGFGFMTNQADAGHTSYNNHSSSTTVNAHNSGHGNYSKHSSY